MAISADASPCLPLKNFPGPNTEQQAEFKIAHSSSPIAEAVIPRYKISTIVGVEAGNCIFREEKPKPASIAAIPKQLM
jgi:hypothetical protein